MVAVAKFNTLIASRLIDAILGRMLAEWDGGADQQMPMPNDLLSSAERLDKTLQRFLQLQKCKFCGAVISQKDTFCEKCGKSQV
jgi:hypothetical protein